MGARWRPDRYASSPTPGRARRHRRARSGWSTWSATATRRTRRCAHGSAATSSCCSPTAGVRIGVLAGKMVVRELLDRLGLSTGTVSRGERSLMYSARRGFSDGERERLAATLDAIYADFVARVAQGRRRPVAKIEGIARGRVWTGSDAVGLGLVDELGGLR